MSGGGRRAAGAPPTNQTRRSCIEQSRLPSAGSTAKVSPRWLRQHGSSPVRSHRTTDAADGDAGCHAGSTARALRQCVARTRSAPCLPHMARSGPVGGEDSSLKTSLAMSNAALSAKQRSAQRHALAAASLGFQKGVAAAHAAVAQQVRPPVGRRLSMRNAANARSQFPPPASHNAVTLTPTPRWNMMSGCCATASRSWRLTTRGCCSRAPLALATRPAPTAGTASSACERRKQHTHVAAASPARCVRTSRRRRCWLRLQRPQAPATVWLLRSLALAVTYPPRLLARTRI